MIASGFQIFRRILHCIAIGIESKRIRTKTRLTGQINKLELGGYHDIFKVRNRKKLEIKRNYLIYKFPEDRTEVKLV